MLTEFSQAEIVELEGDEVVKKHLDKNGRLMTNIFKRFLRDLEQRFIEVNVDGKGGKNTRYFVGERRECLAERNDKRRFNGEGQLPKNYEQGFPIMILEYLIRSSVSEPKTTNSLLKDMGFITDDLFEASKSKYSQNVLNSQIAQLKVDDIIENNTESVVYDYIDREINRLTQHFMGYIQKLEGAKLIIHNKHTMGIISVVEPIDIYDKFSGRMKTILEEQERYIELSSFVIEKVAKMRRDLQNNPKYKHLTSKDIYRYRNKKDVKEYWEEHDILLYQITDENSIQLKLLRTFEAHTLYLQAGDNPIKRWLEKKQNRGAIDLYNSDELQYYIVNREQFHKAREKYVIKLANDRQDNAQKENTKLSGELGGKQKKVEINVDDTEWVKNKKLMFLGLYVEAYEKLQEYYGHTFK
ncbi:hypothetical protein [Priestia megaterium]|uniref:hypothetical protein n=1 Tax=Priestia megaterium TaxID=1404 RepID=UPI00177F3A06|nr:hypothetical protein [Priestia megaterium]MBD8848408.1 hypothetical protein [Priestia megaterium]